MHRRIAAVVVAILSACAVVAVAPESRAAPAIQPGVAITTGDTNCTLNWIYDGTGPRAGHVYGGTAGHCVTAVGQRVMLNEADAQGAPLGTVAHISSALDYSLIEIDNGQRTNVNAAMRGHPDIPQGVSTSATSAVGDTMQFSGYGDLVNLTSVTREQRTGILGFNDGRQHYIYGLVTPGDSGGPVADVSDGNKAFGIVDTVGAALTPTPQIGEGGVSLDGLLADAASSGFPVRVRTVGASGAAGATPPGGGEQAGGGSIAVHDANAKKKGPCRFTVSLDRAPSQTVSVDFATEDADGDAAFTEEDGTLVFAQGDSRKTVSVAVKHRRKSEIELVLSNPRGAALADGEGVCRIGKKQKKRR